MWEFFTTLARDHGLAAVIAVGVMVSFGVAIRALWKKNQELQEQLREQEKFHTKNLAEKDKALTEKEKECADELRLVTVQFVERLQQLQEKRVDEAREVTKVVVTHVETTKNSVEKIRTAMETLTATVTKGPP